MRSGFKEFVNSTGRFLSGAVGDALEGLANFIGLGGWVRENLTGYDFNKQADQDAAFNKLVNAALSKGNDAIEKLQSRIDNLPFNLSPSMKSAVQKARSTLNTKLQAAKANQDALSSDITAAQSMYDQSANAGTGARWSGKAKEMADQAKSRVESAIEQFNQRKTQIGDLNNVEKKI